MHKTLPILLFAAIPMLAVAAPTDADRNLYLRGQWFSFDNFFQAPDNSPQTDISAYRVEAGGAWPTSGQTEVYGLANFTSYDEGLPDASSIGGGLRGGDKPHNYDLSAVIQKNRPSFDVGDTFDSTDHVVLSGRYSYRVGDWQLGVLGESNRQTFDITTTRDNTLSKIGGTIRYRGFGHQFSPEIGYTAGQRSADDANEEHSQDDWWVKLRIVPSEQLYVSVRYRNRQRSYDIGTPGAGNFRREDDRDQWTLSATYRISERFSTDIYYDRLDATSTKASRTFTTDLLVLGIKARF